MSRARLVLALVALVGLAVAPQLLAGAPGPAPAHASAPQGVWTDVAGLPYPPLKRAAAAAYPPNGKIYVFGGRTGIDGDYNGLSEYGITEYTPGNPGTWALKNWQIPHPPDDPGQVSTSNLVAATLTGPAGPAIYLVGGNDRSSWITNTVRIFFPAGNSPHTKAPQIGVLTSDPWPANPRRIPGGYAVLNNKLYIFGGYSAYAQQVYAETWQFDPLAAAGHRWSQLNSANLSVPRAYIAGASLDGYIYAIGGDTLSYPNLVPATTVERLNPAQANATWQTRAPLPTARGDMGAWAYDTGSPNHLAGTIVVAGGPWYVPDSQAYQYHAAQGTWGSFASLNHSTRNYAYAQLNNNLYAIGGYNFANNQPDAGSWVQRYDATAAP